MTSKLETMLNELIGNMSTRHVNHAELEPIKQEILQEALKPTVYQLEYYDGDYLWVVVNSYNESELEKLIADIIEYDKTIKYLDFDDSDAVDEWIENHPIDGYGVIDDLLDIRNYKELSWASFLSIGTIKVSGVQSEAN